MEKQLTRKSILLFAMQMESKLRVREEKGCWSSINISTLFTYLKGEVEELEEAVKRDPMLKTEIVDECADIANYAMMIFDNIAQLTKERGTQWKKENQEKN